MKSHVFLALAACLSVTLAEAREFKIERIFGPERGGAGARQGG
jgi:hypothetical protein